MPTHNAKDYTLQYKDSPEAHKAVYDRCLKWFIENELFHGDSINQTDTTYVEAPNLLTDLAEKDFKFDQEYKEQF